MRSSVSSASAFSAFWRASSFAFNTSLFAWLTDNALHPGLGGEVSWNFNKFLLGRDGALVGRFGSRTAPDAPELIAAIEKVENVIRVRVL